MLQPPSPWTTPVRRQAGKEGKESDSTPLLIIGPVGSLPLECAKEIHRTTGGGAFERVICTPDSAALNLQLFGPTVGIEAESAFFDPEPPNNAIIRATGGTLFLDCVDRCNPSNADCIRLLLARQAIRVNGLTFELDPSTRIIASITNIWMDKAECLIPQWLEVLFRGRVVYLESLGSRPNDVLEAIEWFSWQAAPDRHKPEALWSGEAKEFLLRRQWPGGYEELRDVVRSLVAVSTEGVITPEICKHVLNRYESPGLRPVDNYRRQECYNYAHGLSYMGRTISANEIYGWIEQLAKISNDRRFDPWLTGLRIIKEISRKYYYSTDQLRTLIRNAYLALCAELADHGYMPERSSVGSDASLPDLHALLVNPLGPVKSAAAVLPHMAHLVGAGRSQEVVRVEDMADRLTKDERIQVILFCDDFTGTGQQILNQLIEALTRDRVLQRVCESRSRGGRPVALGIVLGVGFAEALMKIRISGPKWLPVFVHAGMELGDDDRAFSNTSSVFPEPELRAWSKELVVDQVGGGLFPRWPGGFGGLQALVITADNVPNDTLPAIWNSGLVQGVAWKALFERSSSP